MNDTENHEVLALRATLCNSVLQHYFNLLLRMYSSYGAKHFLSYSFSYQYVAPTGQMSKKYSVLLCDKLRVTLWYICFNLLLGRFAEGVAPTEQGAFYGNAFATNM